MNEESEVKEPAAKKQRIDINPTTSKTDDSVDFTEDVTESKDEGLGHKPSKYDDLVTPEEVERLKEFRVLDEVKSNDENSDDNEESDDESEGVPEDEIEKMLEENLPEQFKGVPKPKEKPYVTCQKIILEEKGINQFEVLPLDWLCVRHVSGMPVYLHRPSRVATLARPYALPKGNTKRHEIPISAIPCLSYRKALEEEAKQNEIDKIIEEQIRTGSWKDNLDKETNACTSKNNQGNNKISTIKVESNIKSVSLTKDKGIEIYGEEQNFDNAIKPNNDFDCDHKHVSAAYNEESIDCDKLSNFNVFNEIQSQNVVDFKKMNKEFKINGAYNNDSTENESNCVETSKTKVILNGDNNKSMETGCDTIKNEISKEITKQCPYAHKLVQNPNISLKLHNAIKNQMIEQNQEDIRTTEQKQMEIKYNLMESNLDTVQIKKKSTETESNTEHKTNDTKSLDITGEIPNTSNGYPNILCKNPITSCENSRTSCENPSTSNEDTNTGCDDESSGPPNPDIKVTPRPIVLPGGIVMPPPRVENISTSWKTQHLTADQVNDYCKKLFKFKTVKVMHFVRWPERRKYARARKALQAPPLPRGTTLITLPNNSQGRGRRDWVMNTQGCSYLSVFHEYVQRALQHQPVYEFQQLENASTPYQATVHIGGMQYGVGRGASKRAAKSAAARASMQVLVPGLADWDPARADLAFFEGVGVEDPRVSSLCAAACEPSPHAVLRTCLLRNLGAAALSTQIKKLEHQKIELTMTVGKHSATVVCKNKKTAKQRAAQAILQALHPHVSSWGSLLRLYGSRSGAGGGAARRREARAVTSLQERATHNQPNLAVLAKLRDEMTRLATRDRHLAPLRTMMLDHLPAASSSELNNVDL